MKKIPEYMTYDNLNIKRIKPFYLYNDRPIVYRKYNNYYTGNNNYNEFGEY